MIYDGRALEVFGFGNWSFGLLSGIAWCSGVLFYLEQTRLRRSLY
jgi:hypothetical protein